MASTGPQPLRSPRYGIRLRWLDLLCVAGLIVVLYHGLLVRAINNDSWTYFALSKTVSTDLSRFYRLNYYRQYSLPGPYNASFPPLYPVALALTAKIFDA